MRSDFSLNGSLCLSARRRSAQCLHNIVMLVQRTAMKKILGGKQLLCRNTLSALTILLYHGVIIRTKALRHPLSCIIRPLER